MLSTIEFSETINTLFQLESKMRLVKISTRIKDYLIWQSKRKTLLKRPRTKT